MASNLIEKPAGYLEGALLVATPSLRESCFARSVVYVFAHDEDGAMGLVINHVFDNLNSKQVFNQLHITDITPSISLPIHFGGPVESERGFILHTNDVLYPQTLKENKGIVLSSNVDLLKDIALGKGPKNVIFALGYAGWQGGQLEEEIAHNQWITFPATTDIIFSHTRSSKWLETGKAFGIDLYRISDEAGHA